MIHKTVWLYKFLYTYFFFSEFYDYLDSWSIVYASNKWSIQQCDSQDVLNPHKTLDLTSSLEVGPTTSSTAENAASSHNARSVLTIAFQFPFDSNLQENVATMARQYVRSVISSIQRVATAISPLGLIPAVGPKLSAGSPEALTLAHWINQSYR